MIEIKNLAKKYGELSVLDGISLTINRGEVVAIIGRSGSGKSTFLRCIANLEQPDNGTVVIAGKESKGMVGLGKIGMVFQHFNLFPHMTVLENLIYAPMKVQKMSRQDAEAMAIRLLDQVGMKSKAEFFPAKLSGGQKQRTAIARALMMKPEILLFDEPTSALDPEMVKEVLEVIAKTAETGMTILIVTHEMNFAKEVADRILFFDHGQLVEDSKPFEFFNNPKTESAKQFLKHLVI